MDYTSDSDLENFEVMGRHFKLMVLFLSSFYVVAVQIVLLLEPSHASEGVFDLHRRLVRENIALEQDGVMLFLSIVSEFNVVAKWCVLCHFKHFSSQGPKYHHFSRNMRISSRFRQRFLFYTFHLFCKLHHALQLFLLSHIGRVCIDIKESSFVSG